MEHEALILYSPRNLFYLWMVMLDNFSIFVRKMRGKWGNSRFLHRFQKLSSFWRDARVAEEARLESVYTPKVYRGFESHSLRIIMRTFLLVDTKKTKIYV